ncbi:hypothetical protein [Deinococcus enclensis]|uniref:Uncharacterized protein n=1 Tax=Deinococcus enclensis TaxID=1049582 RepID=A0ABT9MF73_9DEIO|nr:hypothetical protein [Deinococcus enclensis]MDP9765201.1 hypothetical protein [Deinococcus enclensis]
MPMRASLVALVLGAFMTGALTTSAVKASQKTQSSATTTALRSKALAEPSFPTPVAGEPVLAGAEALIARSGYTLMGIEHETLESGAEQYRYAFGAPGADVEEDPVLWGLSAEVNQGVMTALGFTFARPGPESPRPKNPWTFDALQDAPLEERLVVDLLRVTQPNIYPAMVYATMAQGVGEACSARPEQQRKLTPKGAWSVYACHSKDEVRAWMTRPLPPLEFRSQP